MVLDWRSWLPFSSGDVFNLSLLEYLSKDMYRKKEHSKYVSCTPKLEENIEAIEA